MRVKFARPRSNVDQVIDPSFELGKSYLVLGVQFQSQNRPAMVTIQRDTDKTPVMRELQCFDVVDAAIPPDWFLFDFGDGCYSLEPMEFGGNFWDRFHDAEETAERIFERVVERIELWSAGLRV